MTLKDAESLLDHNHKLLRVFQKPLRIYRFEDSENNQAHRYFLCFQDGQFWSAVAVLGGRKLKDGRDLYYSIDLSSSDTHQRGQEKINAAVEAYREIREFEGVEVEFKKAA